MSGGHFDYQQSKINYIADEIENLIERAESGDEYYCYNQQTIEEFKNAIKYLRIAAIYAQRIDWLVSGDDNEDSFHKRLKKQLSEI